MNTSGIRSVTIRNYRSIEDLTLDISANTVVFVGENDSGKSSILSAIRTTLTSESWSGVRPRNKDTGEPISCGPTFVALEFMDGRKIEREYDGRSYKIQLFNSKGTLIDTYSKLPEAVERVRDFTGMRSIKVGNDTLWPQFESLDESPFLITGTTPPALARRINAIIPGASIEAAQDELKLRLRKDTSNLVAALATVTQAEAQRDRLEEPLQNFEELVNEFTEKSDRLDLLTQKLEKLCDLGDKLGEVEEKVVDLSDAVKPVKASLERIAGKTTELSNLQVAKDNLLKVVDRQKLIDKVRKLVDAVPDLTEALTMKKRLETLQGNLETLKKLREDIDDISEEIESRELAVMSLRAQIAEIPQAEVCETCGRPLDV